MKENSETWKVISVILFVLFVCFVVYFMSQPEVEFEECVEHRNTIEDRAILDVQIYRLAENLYDSSEMFFDYWIYNYGDVEAKNVKVKCKLFDKYNNVRSSVTDYYGNLASRSVEFGEVVTTSINTNDGEEFSHICYVESCDNCEILYKRIPDLLKSFEG